MKIDPKGLLTWFIGFITGANARKAPWKKKRFGQ